MVDCATLIAMFDERKLQVFLTMLCGTASLVGWITNIVPIAYLGIVAGSYFAVRSAWESIKDRSLDVNVLMLVAAAGAIAVGRPLDAAGLMFLFSLSGTLETYTLARTKSAIEGLVKLRPDTALRISGTSEAWVKVEELAPGDFVRIPPHTAIPCDGTVTEGESSVDQSAMTGESVPMDKKTGDLLLAGTLNQGGTLAMRVTAGVEDSTLSKIVNLVADAQENKASGERIASWFGERYTWFVLVATMFSFAIRSLIVRDPVPHAFYDSLTLLVALSPCALVISTPASTLSALAYAAKRGILVRGGKYIELAGQVKAIMMDKTGTLTTGRPELIEICVCHAEPVAVGASETGHSECWKKGQKMSGQAIEILAAAASAEQYSAHPIADAIVRRAQDEGIDIPTSEDRFAIPGLGIRAQIGTKTVRVGQLRLFDHEGVVLPEEFATHATEMAAEGMSVALMSYGDEFAAVGLRDASRPNGKSVIDTLRSMGIAPIVMATGDNERTANAVAKEVGVDEVKAGLLPQQKEEEIGRLTDTYGVTMMVGDGINDAPSLARATLGVAMGGLGSDIALNAADIVLMNDNLERIPEIIRLGKKTNSLIRANLVFASSVVILLALTSILWTLPLPVAVLGHEGSTVLVILNGLRLLRGPGR